MSQQAEENSRITRLEDRYEKLLEGQATMAVKLDTALEGVSNFRSFQAETRNNLGDIKTILQRIEDNKVQKDKDDELARKAREAAERRTDRNIGRILRTLTIIGLLYIGATTVASWFGPEVRRALGLPPVNPAAAVTQGIHKLNHPD